MRAATCSVGLVSPRSTWESMGADTPLRSARSRRLSSIASRSARTRGPTETTRGSAATAIRLYAITYTVGFPALLPRGSTVGGMDPIANRPDVLVLGAGGTLGEAWMRGLLSGLESAGGPDMRACEYFVGTSAGSIVAAAGRRPRAGDRASQEWGERAQDADDDDDGTLDRMARMAGRVG